MSRTQPPASGAVLNALAILESFDEQHVSQSLSEISRRLNIAKASAYRNLGALERYGYIVRNPVDHTYSLGPKVLELSQRFLQHNPLVTVARPILEEAAAAIGETAHLGVLDGCDVVYIETAESSQRVRALVKRGDRIAAHVVASGKAILAYSDNAPIEAVLDAGLAAKTSRSLTSRETFLAELAMTRERGFAFAIGEWVEDVVAVAAPVFSHLDQVVGAIGIAAPRSRLDAADLMDIGLKIQEYAAIASSKLGSTHNKTFSYEAKQRDL
ncbi:IclR family transcriptional regulator [Pseudaminobacter sp. NGMCC 1.201702]|uniref:IclR family transcriptional regulator n=1 Tax=Pseudaminobacter sp. NGMCC 1.201702 TaxID=3391825 RepID=UPI0039F0EEB9